MQQFKTLQQWLFCHGWRCLGGCEEHDVTWSHRSPFEIAKGERAEGRWSRVIPLVYCWCHTLISFLQTHRVSTVLLRPAVNRRSDWSAVTCISSVVDNQWRKLCDKSSAGQVERLLMVRPALILHYLFTGNHGPFFLKAWGSEVTVIQPLNECDCDLLCFYGF